MHKTQLETGHMDNPNEVFGGALNVALEGDKQDGVKTFKKEDGNYKDNENSVTRRHQGTQTELCSVPSGHFVHGTQCCDRTT